jgi:hypothetical protein
MHTLITMMDGLAGCLSLGHGLEAVLFAQAQPELFTTIQQAWNNFVQSGQVWALVFGFVLGYLFRSLTAY